MITQGISSPNNREYRSREEQVRVEISKEEAIRRIETQYNTLYDPQRGLDGCFDAWDQLLACEVLDEATPVREVPLKNIKENQTDVGDNDNGIGNDYAIRKRQGNFEITPHKQEIIARLKQCGYRTEKAMIAILLEDLFQEYPSEPGYWFDIANYYTTKSINSVVNRIHNSCSPGHVTIRNPAAYFTYLIKMHPRRKQYKKFNNTPTGILTRNVLRG